jgi:hypothetical protein
MAAPRSVVVVHACPLHERYERTSVSEATGARLPEAAA